MVMVFFSTLTGVYSLITVLNNEASWSGTILTLCWTMGALLIDGKCKHGYNALEVAIRNNLHMKLVSSSKG